MKVFHFTARDVNPSDLATAVVTHLEGMGFTFERNKEDMIRTGVVKASRGGAKGMVDILAQTFLVSPQMSLLEVKKGKGDILEWNHAFTELVQKMGSMLEAPRDD
eukprot:CAMPEP_0173194808 /NCGR_PEP_ID=MMETSP1141-20130122/14709_1 /TAXON_ID=483371 /ORGANISM="non described non described, Strain CCMP2298" /LENGTH=104 /DNA_ID=CAMNT_0014119275 /DNA_START=1 /DNA_END=315 /DNA_ORIENTATION=+